MDTAFILAALLPLLLIVGGLLSLFRVVSRDAWPVLDVAVPDPRVLPETSPVAMVLEAALLRDRANALCPDAPPERAFYLRMASIHLDHTISFLEKAAATEPDILHQPQAA